MRTQFALGAQLFRTGREGQVFIRTARPRTAQGGESLRMRRTWYAGELFGSSDGAGAATPNQQPAQTPSPTQGQGAAASTQQPAAGGDKPEPDKGKDKEDIPDWVKDPNKAYEEIRKLRDENAGHRKTARDAQAEKDKLEADKKAADEKKLADEKRHEELAQKAMKERDEARAELARERLNNLKLRVGTEFKLPPKLIDRLQGSTEDELRSDAEALVKDLGLDKQSEPDKPNLPADTARRQTQTTVAPGGQTVGETDAEKLARMRHPYQVSPLFKPPGG